MTSLLRFLTFIFYFYLTLSDLVNKIKASVQGNHWHWTPLTFESSNFLYPKLWLNSSSVRSRSWAKSNQAATLDLDPKANQITHPVNFCPSSQFRNVAKFSDSELRESGRDVGNLIYFWQSVVMSLGVPGYKNQFYLFYNGIKVELILIPLKK